MKKLIAILMVMAIVAGFVFAADGPKETHTLKVYSTVEEKVPAFQLRFGATITNETSEKYNYTTGQTYAVGSTAVDEQGNPTNAQDVGFDISEKGTHTQTFDAYLVENSEGYLAKTKAQYTITFSDGIFKNVKRKGVGGAETDTLAADSISVAENDDAVADAGITSITPGADSTSVATVIQFSGNTVSTNDLKLCSATYTWTGDPTVDMGTYFADIKLEIVRN